MAMSRKQSRVITAAVCTGMAVAFAAVVLYALQPWDSSGSGNIPGGITISTPAPPAEPADTVPSDVKAGDVIEFARLDWRVLDVQDGRALLVTEKTVFNREYHGNRVNVSWAESDIRYFLNLAFLKLNFTAGEIERIAETRLENSPNPWHDIGGGPETVDRIFLLSLDEVVRYFGDSGQLHDPPEDTSVVDDEHNEARQAYDADGGIELWWLRSPGYIPSRAVRINRDGVILIDGSDVTLTDAGIRPALWLKLA